MGKEDCGEKRPSHFFVRVGPAMEPGSVPYTVSSIPGQVMPLVGPSIGASLVLHTADVLMHMTRKLQGACCVSSSYLKR